MHGKDSLRKNFKRLLKVNNSRALVCKVTLCTKHPECRGIINTLNIPASSVDVYISRKEVLSDYFASVLTPIATFIFPDDEHLYLQRVL